MVKYKIMKDGEPSVIISFKEWKYLHDIKNKIEEINNKSIKAQDNMREELELTRVNFLDQIQKLIDNEVMMIITIKDSDKKYYYDGGIPWKNCGYKIITKNIHLQENKKWYQFWK